MTTMTTTIKTWAARIADARQRGRFSDEDRRMVCNWGTCAVGEARRRDTHPINVSLLNDEAFRLGNEFTDAVVWHRFDDAARLLEKTRALYA